MSRIIFIAIVSYFASCSASIRFEQATVKESKFVFSPTNKKINVTTSKVFQQRLLKVSTFNTALIQSIEYSKLFTIDKLNPDYQLKAVLVHWFQAPFSPHADLGVHYKIEDQKSGVVVFDKEIESHAVARGVISGNKRFRNSLSRRLNKTWKSVLQIFQKLNFNYSIGK